MSRTILYSPSLFHGASGSGGATGSMFGRNTNPRAADKASPVRRALHNRLAYVIWLGVGPFHLPESRKSVTSAPEL
jgi:hypothetical protein